MWGVRWGAVGCGGVRWGVGVVCWCRVLVSCAGVVCWCRVLVLLLVSCATAGLPARGLGFES